MNYLKRIERLRTVLSEAGIESLLVTDEVNVRYLTGFTGDSTYLFVSDSAAIVLSDRRYEEQLEIECGPLEKHIRGPEKWMHELVAETVVGCGVSQLGLEAHDVTLQLQAQLGGAMPKIELKPSGSLVAGLRIRKDDDELRIIRNAIRCSERAFNVLRASLRPEMTELEAAYLLERAIRDFGGEGTGFDTIIAVGPHGALPHYQPGNFPLADHASLLIDWGARVDGYTSDMTRTLSLGAISPRMREIYPIVLDAHLAAIDAIRPGITVAEVDAAARNVIQKAGYGDAFGHGLGHGIGLQVHESPRMAAIAKGELEAGMVVTVEPGIYLPGELGIRIEDDVLVTDSGHEVLCSLPKGLEENVAIL